jgi:hypothetical protein
MEGVGKMAAPLMESAANVAAPLAAAAADGAAQVGAMLMQSAANVASQSSARGASPTIGLGIGASIGAGFAVYRCAKAGAEAVDASAAQALADTIRPSPQLLMKTLDRVAPVSSQPKEFARPRRRRHSWTAGDEKSPEQERQEAALARLLASNEATRLRSTSTPAAANQDAPVTPVTSPDAVTQAASATDSDATRELQRQLEYKLAEVRLLQRQHAQALSDVAQTYTAASTISRKWRQKVQRQATRELLRSVSDVREASEVAKGQVATQVAEKILARHPTWNAHEAAAGVTRVVKIHTVLMKPGSVRRTASWGTPRAGDSDSERAVDFFLFEFAVQLPPKRFSRSHAYAAPHTPQQPAMPQTPPAAGADREAEPELALSPSGGVGGSAPTDVQDLNQGTPSPTGGRTSSHEDIAEAAVAAACANSDGREVRWPANQHECSRRWLACTNRVRARDVCQQLPMIVRFSYGHAKHEAMESAGLFEGAWPPVVYPPHRTTRTLAARLLGAKSISRERGLLSAHPTL